MKLINIYSVSLLYFIPIFLITGPFLPDLALSLIAFLGLINLIYFKKEIFLHNSNFILTILCIFFIYIFINSFFSKNIYLALEHSLFYFRYIFFILGIFFFFKWKGISLLYNFSQVCFYTSIFVSCDLFLQFLTGYNLFGFEMNTNLNGQRYSGFFRDELIAGSYLSRLLPFSIIYFFMSSNKNMSLLNILFDILIPKKLCQIDINEHLMDLGLE